MKKYECIKELHVDCYDDNGHYEEKENVIKVGSVWIIEDEEDRFRMIGGDIRLIKEGDNEYSWLEISDDTLEEHFKEIIEKDRVGSKNKGWLAPSIENKIQSHFNIVDKVYKLLPISKIIVETASFDIQKINNPNIEGKEYQEGDQLGFWNVREYVLFRDGHKCQGKKGCKEKILNVHHIESRKTGGNSPNNLITLCEECHKNYHNGKLKKEFKRDKSFKDASFMGIMRWSFYNRLKELYPNVHMTYGYITKNTRIINNLPKEHRVDARCVSKNPLAKPLEKWFYIKQTRKHNRQIHKVNILKGGKKKLNQAVYEVKGFRLFDKVEFNGVKCFIFGRRTSGYFDLRKLNKEIIHRSASFRKLKLISRRKSLLWEERC